MWVLMPVGLFYLWLAGLGCRYWAVERDRERLERLFELNSVQK
jgi:hypothetical protein